MSTILNTNGAELEIPRIIDAEDSNAPYSRQNGIRK